ncbi:MAG: pseudouridine synthase [Nitrospirota bacterium]|jgi:pseudouridine synthase
MAEERLQKIISGAGIASRRHAEQMILTGRVTVNGKVATKLGTKADPEKDHIKVDGKLLRLAGKKTYLLLNKPRGHVTTLSDPEGRPTVIDLLKGVKGRVYPVGRLDYDTEGLLLLTNDGDFANTIMHPKFEIPKTYDVKLKGVLTDDEIEKIEKGITLEGRRTAPARIKKLKKTEQNSWLEITIHEGRKRQVRRVFERIGHFVLKLKRTRIAFLDLKGVDTGGYRFLRKEEVDELRRISEEGR